MEAPATLADNWRMTNATTAIVFICGLAEIAGAGLAVALICVGVSALRRKLSNRNL